MICPLHLTKICPCGAKKVTENKLTQPYAVGLWVCADGHGTVAGPTLPTNGGAGHCRCRLPLQRISTTIITPRPAGVARDD